MCFAVKLQQALSHHILRELLFCFLCYNLGAITVVSTSLKCGNDLLQRLDIAKGHFGVCGWHPATGPIAVLRSALMQEGAPIARNYGDTLNPHLHLWCGHLTVQIIQDFQETA